MTVGRTYMRGACHARHVLDHSSAATLQTVLLPSPKHRQHHIRKWTRSIGEESWQQPNKDCRTGTIFRAASTFFTAPFKGALPIRVLHQNPACATGRTLVQLGRWHIFSMPRGRVRRPQTIRTHPLPNREYANSPPSHAWYYNSGHSTHPMHQHPPP